MAVGMSAYLANSLLDAVGNATAYSVTNVYIKLHVGDPGSAGTANPAAETTRKVISFGAAAAGVMSNDTAVQWTTITGSEDATHYTLWDDVSAGNFLASGLITANAYTAGDTLTFAIGDIDLAFTVAS